MAAQDRAKALETALASIDRQFGKGSVMRLGDEVRVPIEVIPTGSIALDVALGIGGLPRGRVVEIYGPESSGKTTVALHAVASAQRAGGIAAFIDAEHALDPGYAEKLGVDTDNLLVSQPDTGEQALEIADMLIRSGALDIIVIDSVAALVPRAEIEGEMGDSHVGLQARLMSQALRKITGALSNSGTTAIFINQLREKIGVMFGCFSYGTRVTLADGTQEKIGKIVNQRMNVEVLSYDPAIDQVVPRRVTNWFNNGPTEAFLQFTVAKAGGNGRSQFAATANHLIRTPGGWRAAGEIAAGDRVMVAEQARLSEQQWQVVLGGLMGDAHLAPNRRGRTGRALSHGPRRTPGRLPRLEGIAARQHPAEPLHQRPGCDLRRSHPAAGAVRAAQHRLLRRRQEAPDLGLSQGAHTAGAGHLVHGRRQLHRPRAGCCRRAQRDGSGRAEVCVEAMSPGSRQRLVEHLRDAFGVRIQRSAAGRAGKAVLQFTTAGTKALQDLIAPFIHPSMDYKLLPSLRGRFAVRATVRRAMSAAGAGTRAGHPCQAAHAVDEPL